jgi:GntR family transcriptional regulator
MNANTDELSHLLRGANLELHPDSPVPLYYQLSRLFETLIQEDVFKPGSRFPSEEAISAHFQVSRPTASKAVQILMNDGWLNRNRQDKRSRTTVAEKPFISLTFLTDGLSFIDQFPPGVPVRSQMIWARTIPATANIARVLRLTEGDPVLHMRRLRFAHDRPIMVCDSRISQKRFPNLLDGEFVDGSLYRTLASRFDCPVICSDRRAEAVEATDPEIVRLLGIRPFSSILRMVGVSCTFDKDPVDYLETHLQRSVSLRSEVYRPAPPEAGSAPSAEKEVGHGG